MGLATKQRPFATLAVLACAGGFVGGLTAELVLATQPARADIAAAAGDVRRDVRRDGQGDGDVLIGANGLRFRGPDGRVVARIAQASDGSGVLELYDGRERVVARVPERADVQTVAAGPRDVFAPPFPPEAPPTKPVVELLRDPGF